MNSKAENRTGSSRWLASNCLMTGFALLTGVAWAQGSAERLDGATKGRLFVGTCYQPIDRTPEEIHRDIAMMKGAGFNLVRMGDLSWDSFEPSDGHFSFEWFDKVMDEMSANGIKVVLDIPGLPAPTWLHHKYPGVNIVNQNGAVLYPAERYMDDISDPDYRRLAVRMADALTKRYARHAALLALGYDNEIGYSFMSYSAGSRLPLLQEIQTRSFRWTYNNSRRLTMRRS